MHINKRWNVKMAASIIMVILLCFIPLNCMAKEQAISEGILVEAVADTSIKESPKADAPDIMIVAAGTAMFTVSGEDHGWYKVKLKEIEGYVQKDMIAVFGISAELENEFNDINGYDQKLFTAAEQAGFRKAGNMVWLVVMAVLVILTVLVCVRESRRKKGQLEKEI